jgi:hypothetical protein
VWPMFPARGPVPSSGPNRLGSFEFSCRCGACAMRSGSSGRVTSRSLSLDSLGRSAMRLLPATRPTRALPALPSTVRPLGVHRHPVPMQRLLRRATGRPGAGEPGPPPGCQRMRLSQGPAGANGPTLSGPRRGASGLPLQLLTAPPDCRPSGVRV